MSAVPHPHDRPGGPAHGMTSAEIHQRVVESRAAQGLPPTVEDPLAVERIVALLTDDDAGGTA